MPIVACACGAKYKVADDKLGRTATCRRCGNALLLRSPLESVETIPLAPQHGLLDDEITAAAQRSVEAPRGLKAPREARFDARPEDFGYAPSGSAPAPARLHPKRATRFFGDILWTFLFFTNPHNLAVLIGLWIILGLLQFSLVLGFLFIIPFLLVKGWYAAFKFGVIGAAANGEDDLPRLGEAFDDIWEGAVLPLIRYLVASFVSVLPIILFLAIVFARLGPSEGGRLMDYTLGALVYNDFAPFFDVAGSIVAGALAAILVGMFMWPMFMLVAGLGGLTALARIDLMLATIARTFPAYLLLVLLVYGTSFLSGVTAALISSTGKTPLMLLAILMGMLDVYLTIVTMRLIGLYYFHFKNRFAWSWG